MDQLGVMPGDTLLDVACGRGASALLAARLLGADVVGVDLSSVNVARAYENAEQSHLDNPPGFMPGDAEELPFPDSSFQFVMCESSLGAFPDQPRAIHEMARVLEPGGRVLLSDVHVLTSELASPLSAELGWASCISGAKTTSRYIDMVHDAGFHVDHVNYHDDVLAQSVREITKRLKVLSRLRGKHAGQGQLIPGGHLWTPGVESIDFDAVKDAVDAGSAAVERGVIRLFSIIATKPQ